MDSNHKAVFLFGLAWAFAGLGFSAVYYRYVPGGIELVAILVGLLTAGAISGALLLAVRSGMSTPLGKALVVVGYALFTPVALMAGLLAPGPFEAYERNPDIALAFLAPLAIVLYASALIGLGLVLTGGLAVAAHRLALRTQTPGRSLQARSRTS